MTAEAPRKVVCPLSTSQLVDIIMQFVVLYNEPAGIHLYAYQRVFMRRIIVCVLDKDGGAPVTGLCARQSGKSEALSSLVPALAIILPTLCKAFPDDKRLTQFQEGFWIGIFAPKHQQSTIIYERIRNRAGRDSSVEICEDPDIDIAVTTSRGDQVRWSNGSFVIAQTANEHSNVEGHTFHLVIIDEAQLVSARKIAKEINPMLSATNGVLVEIGTSNAARGGFRDTIVYNVEIEKKGGPRNHFEFPYDVVIAEKRKTFEQTGDPKHLNYEKWVKSELLRLGGNTENEEFRQNFRLLWQEADADAIDQAAFQDAALHDEEFVPSEFNKRVVASIDYGKKRDATVMTIMEVDDTPIIDTHSIIRMGESAPVFYRKKIIAWYEIEGRRWRNILSSAAEILSHYSVKLLVADGTGLGDPLSEQLQDLIPGITVVPFVMSHVGNDKLYKLYTQELEAGRITYVAGEKTRNLLCFQQFVREHDVLMKERLGIYWKFFAPDGDHDDYCDSAALCCYAASLQVEDFASVECGDNPFYASRTSYNHASRAERYRR